MLRWRNGKKNKELNPILAARTLVLAQACAYAGSLSFWAGTRASCWTSCCCEPAHGHGALAGLLAMAGGGLIMVVWAGGGAVLPDPARRRRDTPAKDNGNRSKPTAEGEYAYRSD